MTDRFEPLPDERQYFCPGQSYAISHPLHLARLVSFFPDCDHCPHRDETEDLAPRMVRRLQETPLGASGPLTISSEAVTGVYLNELNADHARRWAAALGVYLRDQDDAACQAPAVVIGGDDRPLTADLVAAVSDGLRMTAGQVIDVGGVSSAALAFAVDHLGADGGLLVGNAAGKPHHVSLKFWRRGARPLSAGGELDLLEKLYRQGVDRPARRGGSLRRFRVEVPYLARLHTYFHALRPLRFVLDTSCRPVLRYLTELLQRVACQIILVGRCRDEVIAFRSDSQQASGELAQRFTNLFSQRPLTQQIIEEGAHFGIRIDDDGETIHLSDERGCDVAAEDLLVLIARHLLEEFPAGTIAVESSTSPRVIQAISLAGGSATESSPTREAMDIAMRTSGALLGGGPSGRIWHREAVPAADALKTLTMLLAILSKSDAPLSQVVDEAVAAQ